MAYRRSIFVRTRLLYQFQGRLAPFSYTHRDYDDRQEVGTNPSSITPEIPFFFHQRFFGPRSNVTTLGGSKIFSQDRISANPASFGSIFARNFSDGSVGEVSADKIDIMTDVADVLGDKVAEVAAQVAPVVNEVAVVAADSFLPVAALQYLIGNVHSYTGLNWWASIVVATMLIRFLQLPLMINQLISVSRFTLLRPKLEEIKEEMQNKGMSPEAVAEGQGRMKALFKEYGVTPFTPLKGIFITGPIFCCFFLAIRSLAENVPSFKEGGALWFTDLSTPDPLFIFPVLTALTFWITVECNAQEGLEGNPSAGTIKNVSRVFAALTIPLTSSFPKAIFFYWITSNLFSLAYGLVLKKPGVKKLLSVPDIPTTKPSNNTKPGLSFSEAIKKSIAAQIIAPDSSSAEKTSSQAPSNPKTTTTSSSLLSQRIKSLEKEVRARKKGKKR